ncbi:hypothetical protein Ancab_008045 [Ancistrocladus abbreviatus]
MEEVGEVGLALGGAAPTSDDGGCCGCGNDGGEAPMGILCFGEVGGVNSGGVLYVIGVGGGANGCSGGLFFGGEGKMKPLNR